MDGRRLDVSTSSEHLAVSQKRVGFNRHISECADCQPSFCHRANSLWRDLCLTALRLNGTNPEAGS